MRKLLVVLLVVLVVFNFAKIKIQFWHAMSSKRMEVVNNLVKKFNETHPDIEIIAQYTGSYAETLTKAIAAYRAGDQPHIVQVYEVGLQTMLDSGAIVPVYKLAEMAGEDFDWGQIIYPILRYYMHEGKLYSMPFNSSSAILYYNKDIFEKAGIDHPPSTFKEVYEIGKKLVDMGLVEAGITFGWPGWILEQMFAYHKQFFANNDNGRSGRATKVLFNSDFGVKLLSEWIKWAQDKVLLYGGREYSANQAFLSGKVAMLIQSTSSVGSIQKAATFRVGTSFLPRLEGYPRGNVVIGGATLWVMKGFSKEEYAAIWEFLKFLLETDNTIYWHKGTGYFPVTNQAVKVLMDEGWFSENPNHLTAFLEILSGDNISPETVGVRLGNFVTIRDIEDEMLEKAFQYKGSDIEAEARKLLKEAEEKANKVLKEYNEIFK
ncbi:MAG: ABC transporter substrate-binding protein [Thermotogaceae bacterium]|nr:ABC transporter substrate-binding protein [Thermotogaceae bacterium]